MTSDNHDVPPRQPDTNMPLDGRDRDVLDFIDETVARITDADVEGHLRKILDQAARPRQRDKPASRTRQGRPEAGSPSAAGPRRRRVSRFLIALAGAIPDIVDRVPGERAKFETLGWAILITSGMAAVSMWFAIATAIGVSGLAATPVALVWALVVMGIDRWLIASVPADSTRRKTLRRLAVAAPRLVLAFIVGIVISTPLVLRIFQPEINNQIAVIQQQRLNEFPESQQQSQKVSYWRSQVTTLEQVIDSRGLQPLNPSADPQIALLTQQLSTATANEQTAYATWQCQLYGGQNCPKKGMGGNAQVDRDAYVNAAARVNQLNNEIHQRQQLLTSSDASASQNRLQQAESDLPAAQAELVAAQARLNSLLQSLKTQNTSNGLLIRLQALSQLADRNPALYTAEILLFLLFLLIECLPLTIRLLQPAGDYEKILAREIDMRLKASLIQEGLQRQRTAAETQAVSLIDDELWRRIERRPADTGQEEHHPAASGPQENTPASTSSGADPLTVPDELRRQIETIYPFMGDTGSESAAPEYRDELENCFMAISEAVQELLRRGYDTAQIIRYLRVTAQQTALLDEEELRS